MCYYCKAIASNFSRERGGGGNLHFAGPCPLLCPFLVLITVLCDLMIQPTSGGELADLQV